MSSRKKLNRSEPNSGKAKRQKKSEGLSKVGPSGDAAKSSSQNNCTLYLSRLPNEVLFCIFKYLSPLDLSALSMLNDDRLTELTLSMREADFSSCLKACQKQISTYFSRYRARCLQKLNFNYNIFVKPSVLAALIGRCKDLRILSIVECGINLNHLANILESCPKLEELAWGNFDAKHHFLYHQNIKKLYLFSTKLDVSPITLHQLTKHLSKVEDVFLITSSYFVAFPLIGAWLKSSCISLPEQNRTFFSVSNDRDPKRNKEGLIVLFGCHEQGNSAIVTDYKIEPYLQVHSMEKYISLISSCAPNIYTALTITITADLFEIYESFIKSMLEVVGNKLNQLSIESEMVYEHKMSVYTEPPCILAVRDMICSMLERLCFNCKNITVLNLTSVHFNSVSPFKAISYLHKLKTFSIPSCSFLKYSSEDISLTGPFCEFEEVVSSCPNVENFVFICCKKTNLVTEDHIIPIKDWKELKNLTVISVNFRSCRFLRKVADSCKYLESFSLLTVEPNTACIFVTDIIYLLKTAKNLAFIRINEPKFNPMFERFWKSVGEAENLEGICINTSSNIYVDKNTVMEGISKLKYLHLFHLFAERVPDTLYTAVKESMEDHGIQNIRIEKKNCSRFSGFGYVSPPYYSYYFHHEQPSFNCWRPHLRDIYV